MDKGKTTLGAAGLQEYEHEMFEKSEWFQFLCAKSVGDILEVANTDTNRISNDHFKISWDHFRIFSGENTLLCLAN